MKKRAKGATAEPEHLPSFDEDTFRNICARMPGMVAVYSIRTGQYLFVNEAVSKVLGYKPADILSGGLQFVTSLMHPDDVGRIAEKNEQALDKANKVKTDDTLKDPIVGFEYRLRHAKGHYVWLHTEGSVFGRKDGKVEYILNISIDITERKKAEDELRTLTAKLEENAKESSDQLNLALEAAGMGIWEVNLQTGELNWPRKTKELLGFKPDDEVTFERFMSVIHPDDRQPMQDAIDKSIQNRQTEMDMIEHRVLSPEGSIRWFLVRGRTIFENERPVRRIGAAINIDSRKKAEKNLRESEERYQAFIRNSNEGIWRFELDEPIPTTLKPAAQIKLIYERAYLAEANDTMARMYGLKSSDSLIGLRLRDLLVESDAGNTEYLTAFIESDYKLSGVDSHEKDLKGKDKYFRNSLVGVVEDGDLVRAWGTQQDVTAQHKADEALRKSEERLGLALNASQLGIWEWNVLTGELTWSDQLKKIFGLRKNDRITFELYLSMLHPEDRPKLEKTIQSAMKSGKSYQIEHRVIRPDGSTHWVLGQGQAFLVDKKPVRMVGTSINIDERKRTIELEAEKLHLMAERKLLMELNVAKDEFISIASHQLRAPATGVKQYIGMLLDGYAGPLTEQQTDFLKIAFESNEREIKIINDLLEIAVVDSGRLKLKKQEHDFNALVKSVLQDYAPVIKKRRQQVSFNPRGTILMPFDMDRIRMVVENIIDNASKYSLPDKKITVTTSRTAKNVKLTVQDEGVGIDDKDVGRLYEKFTRIENELSAERGGTGLGLYWAKRIIDFHGGTIEVRSQPQIGTTFTIRLPR